jgi:DNA-binding CsgD family transcriptional regulator
MKEGKTLPITQTLTILENKILQMMADDISIGEIGEKLEMKPKTIYNILMVLRIKFNYKTNEGMLVMFYKNKLIK